MKDREKTREPFLSRWSRLKEETKEAETKETEVKAPEKPEEAAESKPDLPPVESLSIDSDYSGFFHPEVDEDLRRSALRKLFSDPHFNQMDGLDVYIDDYTLSDPIPPEMINQLVQYTNLFGTREDHEREPAAAERPGETKEPDVQTEGTGRDLELKEQAKVVGSTGPAEQNDLVKSGDKLSQP